MDTLLLQAEQQGSSLLSSSQKQPEKTSKSSDGAVNMKRAPLNLEPIILVPQAASAIITKWNIKKLLEDGEYVTREQQKTSGYKPEERVSVMHQVSVLRLCVHVREQERKRVREREREKEKEREREREREAPPMHLVTSPRAPACAAGT